MPKKKRTILVDADVMLVRTAAACQRTFEDDGIVVPCGDLKEACQRVDNEIAKMMRRLDAKHARFAMTCNEWNRRLDVLPTYKSNRRKMVKTAPILLPGIRKYMREVYKAVVVKNLEADDVVGLWATDPKIKGEKVIVSEDKDLITVPGLHCDPRRFGFSDVFMVTTEEADYNHLSQALEGDKTDGYKGCPGVGPKGAKKILDEDPSWDAVLAAFEKAGLTEESALEQARVARILRHGEYDWDNMEVKLWEPQTQSD